MLLTRYLNDREDGTISAIMGLLERLLKAAENAVGRGSVIEMMVLQAMAYSAQSDIPAALEPLKQALMLAEPEGYIRMFLDEGSSMLRLLREASEREIIPIYTDKLLSAFEEEQLMSVGKSSLPTAPASQPLIEPISRREARSSPIIQKRTFRAGDCP